ncbi:hypothetical protein Gorai_015436 [Gossypium raimondii]|uniref:Pseudouridine synthase RsuA/RluA-like domain-containing protein n=1 Tax=Gossypium raimondii TaxID=29730 RepID=A0A7J8P620_GOSRA|nr:hypothetical protein [Gossypium raimondii]
MSSNSNSLQNYPTPLSPPLPSISKDIELARAMSASSKSSLFGLSRSDILYEDEWLIAVNKPQGIYCDTILASVPRFLSGSAPSDRLCEGPMGDKSSSVPFRAFTLKSIAFQIDALEPHFGIKFKGFKCSQSFNYKGIHSFVDSGSHSPHNEALVILDHHTNTAL